MTEAASTHPFEELMAEGVRLNNARQHDEALRVRLQAYSMSEPGSVDNGRAARDVGHSFASLGDGDMAVAYAEQALQIHEAAVSDGQPGAEREFRASAGYVGSTALVGAITSEEAGQVDRKLGKEALERLGEAIDGPKKDQYTINFMGRFAAAHAVYGRRTQGLRLAMRAVRLGLHSEAQGNPTSTPNLSLKARLEAKAKAVGRGVLAGAAAIVGPHVSDHNNPPQTSRRQRALSLARRVA